LIVKGYGMRSQRFEDYPDIELRATGDTYVDIWKVKANKFIDEIKHLFSWRWDT
jgi:hypothetical protein